MRKLTEKQIKMTERFFPFGDYTFNVSVEEETNKPYLTVVQKCEDGTGCVVDIPLGKVQAFAAKALKVVEAFNAAGEAKASPKKAKR